MRSVLYRYSRFFLSTIPDKSQLHLGADGCLRNGIHKVIAGFDGLAVHASDNVTTLEASLFGRTARFDVFNHHTVGRAKGLEGNRVRAEFFLKLDPNRASRHTAI